MAVPLSLIFVLLAAVISSTFASNAESNEIDDDSLIQFSQYQFRCPALFGKFAHPQRCDIFIQCQNGQPVLMSCQGFYFDPNTGNCLDRRYVPCHNGQRKKGEGRVVLENYQCPQPFGTFFHPQDCSKFISCIQNVPVVMECDNNNLFDVQFGSCQDQRRVNCGGRFNKYGNAQPPKPNPPAPSSRPNGMDVRKYFTCPYNPGTFAHPYDCSLFIVCSQNIPFLYTCDENSLFDTITLRCVNRNYVRCEGRLDKFANLKPIQSTTTKAPTTPRPPTTTARPTTAPTTKPTTPERIYTRPPTAPTSPRPKPNTPPPHNCDPDDLDCILDVTGNVADWFECHKRYGHHPHGSSTRLFIKCDNYVPYVKKCADNTFFNEEFLVCMD